MLAIMRLGAIYVPLDLRNPLPRLASVAVDCEPKAVLVDETTLNDVAKLNVHEFIMPGEIDHYADIICSSM